MVKKGSTRNSFGGGSFEGVERQMKKGKVQKLFPNFDDAMRTAKRKQV